jgi:hypothetical protein
MHCELIKGKHASSCFFVAAPEWCVKAESVQSVAWTSEWFRFRHSVGGLHQSMMRVSTSRPWPIEPKNKKTRCRLRQTQHAHGGDDPPWRPAAGDARQAMLYVAIDAHSTSSSTCNSSSVHKHVLSSQTNADRSVRHSNHSLASYFLTLQA